MRKTEVRVGEVKCRGANNCYAQTMDMDRACVVYGQQWPPNRDMEHRHLKEVRHNSYTGPGKQGERAMERKY